jgi:hypothetical protein
MFFTPDLPITLIGVSSIPGQKLADALPKRAKKVCSLGCDSSVYTTSLANVSYDNHPAALGMGSSQAGQFVKVYRVVNHKADIHKFSTNLAQAKLHNLCDILLWKGYIRSWVLQT